MSAADWYALAMIAAAAVVAGVALEAANKAGRYERSAHWARRTAERAVLAAEIAARDAGRQANAALGLPVDAELVWVKGELDDLVHEDMSRDDCERHYRQGCRHEACRAEHRRRVRDAIGVLEDRTAELVGSPSLAPALVGPELLDLKTGATVNPPPATSALADEIAWRSVAGQGGRSSAPLDDLEQRGDAVVQVRDVDREAPQGELGVDVLDLADPDHRAGVALRGGVDELELGTGGAQELDDPRVGQGYVGLAAERSHESSPSVGRSPVSPGPVVGAPGAVTPGADVPTVGDPTDTPAPSPAGVVSVGGPVGGGGVPLPPHPRPATARQFPFFTPEVGVRVLVECGQARDSIAMTASGDWLQRASELVSTTIAAEIARRAAAEQRRYEAGQ